MRTITVIPTYNEVENLPVIAGRLLALDQRVMEILVVGELRLGAHHPGPEDQGCHRRVQLKSN